MDCEDEGETERDALEETEALGESLWDGDTEEEGDREEEGETDADPPDSIFNNRPMAILPKLSTPFVKYSCPLYSLMRTGVAAVRDNPVSTLYGDPDSPSMMYIDPFTTLKTTF